TARADPRLPTAQSPVESNRPLRLLRRGYQRSQPKQCRREFQPYLYPQKVALSMMRLDIQLRATAGRLERGKVYELQRRPRRPGGGGEFLSVPLSAASSSLISISLQNLDPAPHKAVLCPTVESVSIEPNEKALPKQLCRRKP